MRPSSTHRVEPGKDHGLGCVVDDDVDPGGLLESADIPTLPADDPALHFVGGKLHDGNSHLGGLIGRHTLDGQTENLLGLAIGSALGFFLDFAKCIGCFGPGLVL